MGIPGIITTPGDGRQPFGPDRDERVFELSYLEHGGKRRFDEVPVALPGINGFSDKKSKKKDKEKATGLGSARGTETFFRNGYRAQLELTQLADNKANIMISINGIIMSVLIVSSGVLASQQLWLLGPAFTLLVTCLVSTVYAVLAARPDIDARSRSQQITSEDVRKGRGMLLFFGNFTQISEDDYVKLMLETLDDKKRIYSQMAHHIYCLGEALKRKFCLLRTSYTVFIIGLSATIAMFISSFAFFRVA